GMPYGLPPLSEGEHQLLTRWLEAGAPYREPEALDPRYQGQVDRWEAFLNGDGLKARLASRYLYEHWFLAHLYFDELNPTRYFEVVRSRTAPGAPIDLIATRLPYDDPGVPRVYYRLRPIESTLVAKTHMPYALNEARLKRLASWFMDSDYRVAALPSYVAAQAANPFITFADIPAESRYRFLLDEAQYTIMGFIKGPVCRGQVAVDVINDHFWVVFIDPGLNLPDHDAEFLATNLKDLRMPSEEESRSAPLTSWFAYSDSQSRYLKAKSELMNRVLGNKRPPTLDLVWDGGGKNPNAALTVFRHFDSASVVKGFVGEDPETLWLIGYPLLERIHYLLVAGFDVYGSVGHQLHSRLYMNFLRMEAEFNILALLPKRSRDAVRDHWYRDADDKVKAYLNGTKAHFDEDTGVVYKTDQPYPELQALLSRRLAKVDVRRHAPSMSRLPAAALEHLRRLTRLRGRAVSYLPEASFLTLREEGGSDHVFTVLRNSAHSNVAYLFDEESRRLPDEDTVTLAHGFIDAYPNAFYLVTTEQLPEFVDAVRGLASEDDYAALAARYAIRRTDDRFWSHSDALHASYRAWTPIEAALFDYNRFENR
ncbi:MAG: fatty acid cis/trans isomerase, partial [Gammaproteobacteria bacterium]